MDKVQVSLAHDGERYQVTTPWKLDCPILPNNYEMAYSSLRNTEMRLIQHTSVGKTIRELSHPTSKRDTSGKYPKPKMNRNVYGISLISQYVVQRGQQQTRIVFDASAKFCQALSCRQICSKSFYAFVVSSSHCL